MRPRPSESTQTTLESVAKHGADLACPAGPAESGWLFHKEPAERSRAALHRRIREFVAPSAAAMLFRRLLWLALPVLGSVELGAHVYFSERAPKDADWTELPGAVQKLRRPGDVVIVTPAWAEPLARRALGEELMPLSDVGRSDINGYSHAIEVSLLGQRSSELAGFRALTEESSGAFTLRRLQNPGYRRVLYAFVDHVRPGELSVAQQDGNSERPCPFTDRARPSAGGLGGPVAYPTRRFACSGGGPFFVGVTVVDDANYRPRRCIHAQPLPQGVLRLRFPDVPRGQAFWGSAGASFLVARDGIGMPVELTVSVDGKSIGRRAFRDQDGFVPFEFRVPKDGPARVEVTLDVVSESRETRNFCFAAEMR